MSIHKSLVLITAEAIRCAKKHKMNYNIIIHNPVNGEFDAMESTYEFVLDSYFEKPRPNVKLLHKTDDLLRNEVPEAETTTKLHYTPIEEMEPIIIKELERPPLFFGEPYRKPSTNNRHRKNGHRK